MKHHKYAEIEKQFLRENIHKYTYEDLTKKFNKKFNTDLTKYSISDMCCKRMKIHRNCNTGIYKKGNIKEQLPIGTVRKCGNGTTYIKIKDSKHSYVSGYAEPYWKALQKKIYEDYYGPIKHNQMIIFLDHDNNNFDIENLYCIDRRISAIMASNSWYSENKEQTLTAIKYCELYYALKD